MDRFYRKERLVWIETLLTMRSFVNNLLAPFTSNLRKYYIKESFVRFEKLQTIVYYHHRLFIIMMPGAILIPCLSKDEVFVRMKMLVCGGNRKGLEEIVVIFERIIVVYSLLFTSGIFQKIIHRLLFMLTCARLSGFCVNIVIFMSKQSQICFVVDSFIFINPQHGTNFKGSLQLKGPFWGPFPWHSYYVTIETNILSVIRLSILTIAAKRVDYWIRATIITRGLLVAERLLGEFKHKQADVLIIMILFSNFHQIKDGPFN